MDGWPTWAAVLDQWEEDTGRTAVARDRHGRSAWDALADGTWPEEFAITDGTVLGAAIAVAAEPAKSALAELRLAGIADGSPG